jgi:FkbM family methyltransferase
VAWQKLADRIDWFRLSRALDVRPRDDLVRLGSVYGGYELPKRLPQPDWVCYCAGLGEDVTFELALIEQFGCSVYAFDPTPRSAAHVERVARDEKRLQFLQYGLWSEDTTLRFFAPRDPDHVSHSIVNLQHTDEYFDAECRSVTSLMKELGHDRVDLLKLDVEGAEYEVLSAVREAGVAPQLLIVDFDKIDSLRTMLDEIERVCAGGYTIVALHRTDVTFVQSGA